MFISNIVVSGVENFPAKKVFIETNLTLGYQPPGVHLSEWGGEGGWSRKGEGVHLYVGVGRGREKKWRMGRSTPLGVGREGGEDDRVRKG